MGRTGRCAPTLRLRSGHRRGIPIAAQADPLSALDRSGAALYALREEGVEPAAAVLLCRAAANLQHHGIRLLAVATITG